MGVWSISEPWEGSNTASLAIVISLSLAQCLAYTRWEKEENVQGWMEFLTGSYSVSQEWNFRGWNEGIIYTTSENKREQDLPSLFHAVMELWHSDTGAGRYCQLRSPGKASVEQSTGNSEQTSLLCLWSRVKDAKGSFRTSHGRKPERDLGTKLPPKCECACSVFQCTVSEAWWENWRLCGNLEFGDFGLFLLTSMVFESYQCELSEICFLSENGIICWFSKLHRKIKKAWAI